MTEEEIKEFQDCFTGRPIPRDGVPPAALGCYREHGSTGPYPTFPRPQWKPSSPDCAGPPPPPPPPPWNPPRPLPPRTRHHPLRPPPPPRRLPPPPPLPTRCTHRV